MVIQGRVNKIIRFSSVDGPGNRSAIFLQGCNFNCIYCHNPETIGNCISCMDCIEACPVAALTSLAGGIDWNPELCVNCDSCIKSCTHLSSPKTRLMTASQVFEEIGSGLHFIRGITVSGGECTLQPDFTTELFTLAKQKNLSAFADSNGYADLESLPKLVSAADSFMLDVKAYDRQEHVDLTGKSNETVLNNLRFLGKIHKLFEVRTVIAPSLFNIYSTVDAVSKIIGGFDGVRYKLIKFRPIGARKAVEEPSRAIMEELREIAGNNGVKDISVV